MIIRHLEYAPGGVGVAEPVSELAAPREHGDVVPPEEPADGRDAIRVRDEDRLRWHCRPMEAEERIGRAGCDDHLRDSERDRGE